MTTFLPLSLRLVVGSWADRVPSPAHDSLSAEQRQAFVDQNPDTYLLVTRSPDDLSGGGVGRSALEALLEGRHALDRLLREGAFTDEQPQQFFVYRLVTATHQQTGIVGGIAIDDYRSGELRVHEQVQADRTEHLAQHLGVVGAQSSPIAVAHRPDPEISEIVNRVSAEIPLLEAKGRDGLVQSIWPVSSPTDTVRLTAAMATQPTYLMDGHHRAAAAAMFQERAAGRASELILVAAFSSEQLLNRPFHRWLVTRTLDDVLNAVERTEGTLSARTVKNPGDSQQTDDEILLYGDHRWVALKLPTLPGTDIRSVLSNLDPVRLELSLFRSLLGIEPTEGEDELRYRPGNVSMESIVDETDRLGGVVCFNRAVPVDVILDAADAGLIMPPKSTFFEPKVRSGVFVRSLAD